MSRAKVANLSIGLTELMVSQRGILRYHDEINTLMGIRRYNQWT